MIEVKTLQLIAGGLGGGIALGLALLSSNVGRHDSPPLIDQSSQASSKTRAVSAGEPREVIRIRPAQRTTQEMYQDRLNAMLGSEGGLSINQVAAISDMMNDGRSQNNRGAIRPSYSHEYNNSGINSYNLNPRYDVDNTGTHRGSDNSRLFDDPSYSNDRSQLDPVLDTQMDSTMGSSPRGVVNVTTGEFLVPSGPNLIGTRDGTLYNRVAPNRILNTRTGQYETVNE